MCVCVTTLKLKCGHLKKCSKDQYPSITNCNGVHTDGVNNRTCQRSCQWDELNKLHGAGVYLSEPHRYHIWLQWKLTFGIADSYHTRPCPAALFSSCMIVKCEHISWCCHIQPLHSGVFRGRSMVRLPPPPPQSDREFLDNFRTVLCKLCFMIEP